MGKRAIIYIIVAISIPNLEIGTTSIPPSLRHRAAFKVFAHLANPLETMGLRAVVVARARESDGVVAYILHLADGAAVASQRCGVVRAFRQRCAD